MPDNEGMSGGQPSGGTRFPFISLEKAIGRAQALFDADQRGREMAISGAFAVWEYSEKSSGGFQTIAALKMYGLLKDSNGGDSRKVALTDDALRYFRDEREEEQKKLLARFAVRPKLIAALWNDWGASPPADPIARSHLKAERGLHDQGARTLLAIYKENLEFADLKGSSKISDIEPDNALDTQLQPVKATARDPFVDVFGQMFRSVKKDTPTQAAPAVATSAAALPQSALNEIKVMLDGDVIRVTAVVDAQGAKKLMKALKANIALLNDEDDAEDEPRQYRD